MAHSPLPHPGTGPFPTSRGLPTLSGRCAALATRPSPPRPLVPSSRVYTPPGRQQPCGAGPLDPHPSRDRFVHLARVAPFQPFSAVLRPRSNPLGCCAAPSHSSSRVYTPPGHQQPCDAGQLDPHPSGDRFVRLARVAPLPPPPLTPVPPPRAHRLGRAPLRPGCSYPGRLFVVFSPLPRTLQSVAPGSPPDDPVWGLGPCSTPPRMLQSGASLCRILSFASDAPVRGTEFTPRRSSPGLVPCFSPPRMLQSGASFYRILSVSSDAPVRGTWFIPGRSSPGARAVLHSAPVAPIQGVFLSYSLRCLRCSSPGTGFFPGRSSPGAWAVLLSGPDAPIRGVFLSYSLRSLGRSSLWHRVHPRTIQSGG